MISKPIFKDAWKKANKNIFRLEILPEYRVPEDLAVFEKWKKSQANFELGKKSDVWQQNLKSTKARGVQIQRVRITPLPLPEYIRYEIDYWRFSTKNGEEIFFLKEDYFADIKSTLNFEPEDFWLLDDEDLIIFYYENGDLAEERPISDPKIIDNYKQLKYQLLERALPMDKFLNT